MPLSAISALAGLHVCHDFLVPKALTGNAEQGFVRLDFDTGSVGRDGVEPYSHGFPARADHEADFVRAKAFHILRLPLLNHAANGLEGGNG